MGGALVLFLCFGVVAGRVALRGVVWCFLFWPLALCCIPPLFLLHVYFLYHWKP
jgi:hypothetical protein